MLRFLGLISIVCLFFVACDKKEPKLFVKLEASRTGIDFNNELVNSPELNILTYLYYYNGAGVAAADFNNDGWIDLFFTANQSADKLYLNKGDFQFRDVSSEAQLSNDGGWSTGVTYVDINEDGLLDIYVCKVGGYRILEGRNLLYVNQGVNNEGIPVFEERATDYGLDFSGLSTQASFFDYDLDGDLDMFLMNHSVHPNRAYGRGTQRTVFDPISGDRLFRNNEGKFEDVSEEAGIYRGKIGYGLGLGISDINRDGYPDIYVGNDFFENDYLYLNQKDGTFKELISDDPRRLGHTTHYSMGNDLADVNNDGLVDIVSLDMLPENLETYKASGLEYAFPTYQYYLKNGYAPQYMQNTLHLNLGNATFSEIGHLSGIAATEWSWGALFADYDNDGYKDLFISNGIKGATNDMDFVNFISNDAIQQSIEKGMTEAEMNLIEKIPETRVPNYFYRNLGDLKFKDVTEKWADTNASFSNGCIYADLDNDGDLDLVVNNVNEEAFVMENRSDNTNGFLQIAFKGNKANPSGIGAKVEIHTFDSSYFLENYVTRGYLSTVPPVLSVGLGSTVVVDSIIVTWPVGTSQIIKGINANQQITLDESEAKIWIQHDTLETEIQKPERLLPFVHRDQTSIEFNRNPLIPYASTNEGPGIAVADINQDGRDDIFLGGSKLQASVLLLQNNTGSFEESHISIFEEDVKSEDVSAVFFDANGDNWTDLLVVSGGNEYQSGPQLQPRLYLNKNGFLVKDTIQFKDINLNASKVGVADIDKDGDLDVTITSDLIPWEFGKDAEQYIFENDGQGSFSNVTLKWAPEFVNAGNVKDFIWKDIDKNGFPDLIVAGQWMPVSIYLNSGTALVLQNNNGLQQSNGWWFTVAVEDFDKDGDLDLVAGNFGENSLLAASKDQPVTLYRQDFDNNGSTETVVSYYNQGQETALASKDELAKQMPYLNKNFLSYQSFAKASLADLFTIEKLRNAERKYAYTLATTYFENMGDGSFTPHELAVIAQASTVRDIQSGDINGDGYSDLILIGNNYEISTQLGSMDASHGVILMNDQAGGFDWVNDQKFSVSGPARNINQIVINNKEYCIIGINNAAPILIPNNK